MIESLLLGLSGGLLGWALSILGVRAFTRIMAAVRAPYWIDFSMDLRSFIFLFSVTFATAVLFGLAPALQSTRVDIIESLKEGGRSGELRSRRLAGVLITGQLALTVVLLVAAGLMMRSFLELQRIDIGVKADNLLTMRVALAETQYPETRHLISFYEQLARRLTGAPGIDAASIMSHFPTGWSMRKTFVLEGHATSERGRLPSVSALVIDPRYFETIGVRLVRGRNFTEADGRNGAEAVIVNDRFAARYWPGEEPIGKRIRLERQQETYWATVIGVCPPIKQFILGSAETDSILYLPFRQEPMRVFVIAARSRTSSELLAKTLRAQIREIDADLPGFDVSTLREFLKSTNWPFQIFGTLFGIFAFIALGLSSMGVYGLIAYSVSRRTREIGVRIALGAMKWDVFRLVVKGAVRHLAIGLALGLIGAAAVSRLLRAFLVGTTPTDPHTFISIAVLLIVVTIAASAIPAWRAMLLNPLEALRAE
jgi:putative ABC transport system permease protein